MKANRQHQTEAATASTLVATLADAPDMEVELLASYEEFSHAMDVELSRLESHYAAFCTPDSLRVSLGR